MWNTSIIDLKWCALCANLIVCIASHDRQRVQSEMSTLSAIQFVNFKFINSALHYTSSPMLLALRLVWNAANSLNGAARL